MLRASGRPRRSRMRPRGGTSRRWLTRLSSASSAYSALRSHLQVVEPRRRAPRRTPAARRPAPGRGGVKLRARSASLLHAAPPRSRRCSRASSQPTGGIDGEGQRRPRAATGSQRERAGPSTATPAASAAPPQPAPRAGSRPRPPGTAAPAGSAGRDMQQRACQQQRQRGEARAAARRPRRAPRRARTRPAAAADPGR